jgi:hypothetical protein
VTIFVLWFVFTVMPGQLMHMPMDQTYATMQECEDEKPILLDIVRSQFPNDDAVRVYCTKYQPAI